MDQDLKGSIVDWMNGRVEAVGFASLDRFDGTPKSHHPSRICKDAETVIVFGKTVPKGVLNSPEYGLHLLHRSYHTVYPFLDELGMDLANWIEAQGYMAVQVPSYAPLVYHGAEPWGILSLKHAAVAAGLGSFGRSEVVLHPTYGSLLRLGAVVTNAKMPADPLITKHPCPSKCRSCQEACPPGAFQNESFQKQTCLAYTIRHGIYPLALRDEAGRKHMEMIINTAGYNYWLKCNECLKVCPKNRMKKSKTKTD